MIEKTQLEKKIETEIMIGQWIENEKGNEIGTVEGGRENGKDYEKGTGRGSVRKRGNGLRKEIIEVKKGVGIQVSC